ncbi:TetR family transcriptional regulator [Streptomyces echinatus]|uniref:AcrR family transcriptional regulator n=1 Tax=Streptomyces echinatus TaxID=67293 RepID=A0A7W9PVJ7_9ACTN|nr:TetR family transcriptional regulator [Streptomyces echinatus]MBB5928729.1 AcrR family transcriptional regulator [Streptomyces echinatus]
MAEERVVRDMRDARGAQDVGHAQGVRDTQDRDAHGVRGARDVRVAQVAQEVQVTRDEQEGQGAREAREPGRRDRKKAATRRNLLRTAARMFADRGYQQTTVKDIAAAAGVTERTFFRYFPSKEDLVFAEILDFVPPLKEEIAARPADEPPYTAVLGGLFAAAGRLDGGLGILFVGAPPRALSTGMRRSAVLTDFEDGIAEALAARLAHRSPAEPAPARALRAAVLARASVAAVRSALIAFTTRDATTTDPPPPLEDFAALLHEAFAVLRSGGE